MKKVFLIPSFLLVGCNVNSPPPPDKLPENYNCSVEQMERVQKETAHCGKNSGLDKTSCYIVAMSRHCEKKSNDTTQKNTPFDGNAGIFLK